MSVKIRLKRMGSKKKPFYRFVATDSRNPRDGRFIETLGYYNPMTDPPDLKIDEAAVTKWMERGAQPTSNTESLLRKIGFMQKWQLLKQGLTGDALEARLSEIKAASTPPKSPDEKAREAEMKKQAKAEAEKAAEEKAAAEKAAEAEPEKAEAEASPGQPAEDAAAEEPKKDES